MTRPELVATLTPLLKAMRTDFDAATWTAYFRVMADVPVVLLAHAVESYFRTPLQFFPKAPEIRAACEVSRRQQLALVPYDGCPDCEDQKGWRTVAGPDGHSRMERCPCRARHQAQLEARGLSGPLSQLPGEAEPQGESVYPTVEQLPADLRTRLLETVRQKVLR